MKFLNNCAYERIMQVKILFMGTPDFAETCLDALIKAGKNVVGVITQPDKKQGRGMKVAFCDVKKYAIEQGLEVYQPESLRDGAISGLLEKLSPDIIVVVAYGKILPQYVLDFPKYGCVNVHGSLLPAYRGAAPIQRAVINGDACTGITTMFMAAGMDTGDILLTERVPIGENTTTGELFDTLAECGGRLLVKTLEKIESGKITRIKQDDNLATYAEKISNEECLINFSSDAKSVHNRIRGLSPFPGAFAYLDGKIVKLYDSVCNKDESYDGIPGKVIRADAKNGVTVGCLNGTVTIRSFKPEGKGILSAADMINGRKIAVGSVFSSDSAK